MTAQPTQAESLAALFEPPPDRSHWEGWQEWRASRGSFRPAARRSLDEYRALSPQGRFEYDFHRIATHANLRLQETPMSRKLHEVIFGRLLGNATIRSPGTRDGLMISGEPTHGKTETTCWAAADFEGIWRTHYARFVPGPAPGTRDNYAPIAYCKVPPKATPKSLCQVILDIYDDRHPGTQSNMLRAVRDTIRDHRTNTLIIDDITRLNMDRKDDQDTLDVIRSLMDLGTTLVLVGFDIPKSGLLRGARRDPVTKQYIFPTGRSHAESASAQTGLRFDLVNIEPFRYSATGSDTSFAEHLAGIEEQLRLLKATESMLTGGDMPAYLYEHTHGSVGLLRRLIDDGCKRAMRTREERLTRDLLAGIRISVESLGDLDPESGEIPRALRQDPLAEPKKPRPKKPKPRNTVLDDHGTPLDADA
ncbi:MAG TPA: AAA family ATPase [Trebonia sp.]|jgi:hypothetical protein